MQADMDTNLFEDWTDGPAEGWTWVEDLEVDPETVCDPNNKDLLLEAVDEIASLKKQLATMQAEYDTLIEEHHELIRANMKLGVPF